jgi:uncharacterized membrane protein
MSASATITGIFLIVHVLAGVVWVGGMFFAHQVLRPSAMALEAPPRLELWSGVLARFFLWVIAAIVLLLATGFAMVFSIFGGFAHLAFYVQLMMGLGIVMMLLFLHLYFAPWRRFRAAVGRHDWVEGGRQLGQIRMIVTINLVLGLITIAAASGGSYWQ